jgi:hypothetical protein
MPLAIDLFAGLGGWTDGFLAEGWNVVGFDVTRHVYGADRYPAQLVLQDVLTIHGSQFRNADIIVASPPCQQYSWLAMPWSRSKDPNNSKAAKALRAKWEAEGPDNKLFNACFRIQREAIYARRLDLRCCELDYSKPGCKRCHIPLIVENVRGAQPWVGRSVWNYGSFHFWGDVPALMPINLNRRFKSQISCAPRKFADRIAETPEQAHALHYKLPGVKVPGQINKRDGHGHTRHLTNQAEHDAVKVGGDWFRDPACHSAHASRSNARKAASAMIAKIPLPLSTHIARVYWPIDQPRPAARPEPDGGTSAPASDPTRPVSA